MREGFKRKDCAALTRQSSLDYRPAAGDVSLDIEPVKPLSNFGTGARTRQITAFRIQPVAGWPCSRITDGQDFDRLTIAQYGLEGHEDPVDPCAAALMAQFSMNLIGKIKWRRAHRQLEHPSLRRQHVQVLIRHQTRGNTRTQLLPHITLPRQQLTHPGNALCILRILGSRRGTGQTHAALFVQPVCGRAIFGVIVHFLSTDLDLERTTVFASNYRMQGSITVRLGSSDVIVVFARHRLPQRIDNAQHRVALAHIGHDDPKCPEILHLIKLQILRAHL